MSELSWTISEWKFKEFEAHVWLPAQVPGCVHTDLLRNGKIPDPFYGTNEHRLQWIDKQDWEYETAFEVPAALLAMPKLEIIFKGLDTYADVSINGRHVLSADNMFRTWIVNVKDQLHSGNNTIHIRFRSPVKEDLPKLEKLGYALPATNDQSELGGLGDKKISIFARKSPYHYGWDWGPRFVTSGIWREVRLVGWSDSRISDLYIRQDEVTSAAAKLMAVVEIESAGERAGSLRVSTGGLRWEQAVFLTDGVNKVELSMEVPNPKLWWSRGLGDPHQYMFKAEWFADGDLISEKTVKTGLRAMKLIREKDQEGTSFYIELNGVAVFAKGANHIPNDSFITEVTFERYRHEIVTAAESNMNMLRVWGGGLYEQDAFYELCDEYGMLVWQDFMFACSMYPGDKAFLLNVRMEAEENVKRLRNHPCIALWCGNNEIEGAWAHYDDNMGWGWKKEYTPELREKLWADYEAIFHAILPTAVETYAPQSAYWPSSPMTGLTGNRTQHATSNTKSGDIHYWGVWHAVEPFENYNINIGRFMSEYGFQSFPEYRSVRTYAQEEDLALESEVMLAHQKNNRGNQLIKEYMDMYLQEPKDFPSFLYMSQVLQAEAMKMAIEAHRRRKSYCMGTLYWQMNDCWPVASWAGMDYYGRWKALQYYAKRSFRDTLLSIDGTSGESIDFHVVSDTMAPVSGTLRVRLFDFVGTNLRELTVPAQAAANTATILFSITVEELLEGRNPASVVLFAELEQTGVTLDNKEHYFVPAKQLALCSPVITVSKADAGVNSWTLTTDALAKQVCLSTESEGVFSDNYFDLIPGIPKSVAFYSRGDGDLAFEVNPDVKIEVCSMSDFIKS